MVRRRRKLLCFRRSGLVEFLVFLSQFALFPDLGTERFDHLLQHLHERLLFLLVDVAEEMVHVIREVVVVTAFERHALTRERDIDRATVDLRLHPADDAVLHEGVDRLGDRAGGQTEDAGDVFQHRGLVHVREKITDDADLAERYLLVVQHVSWRAAQPLTLAHNDAQRSNIVKSLEGKYFFIDFEFAANNDPVYDIGTFGNGDALEGKRLLEEYEKLVPLKDGLKRYALWRIDISLQWYLVAVIKHYRGEGKIHGIDFLAVGKHFLGVAEEAYKLIK